MTQYKTKDGVKIEVGGVYYSGNDRARKFTCYAMKAHDTGYGDPLVGLIEGSEYWISKSPDQLTSIPKPEPEPVYDPNDMWVLYVCNNNGYREYGCYSSLESAQNNALATTHDVFAIAKVGQKFKRGENL